jgi:ubiquinone/menaquinone biosynthesis C-methylase UbiE
MNTSSEEKVRRLYEDSADWYAEMMDAEIDLPVYSDSLSRLSGRITRVSGPLIDTSCGPGHMLSLYHERFDSTRSLLGIDLSPRMVAIAKSKLGAKAKVLVGDMRDLSGVESGSAAAIVSFFAIHHLNPADIATTLHEWHRVLKPRGQLLIAAWEGDSPVDYGDQSDVVALRYGSADVADWVRYAGFEVDRCSVESVEDVEMDATYLEGSKL